MTRTHPLTVLAWLNVGLHVGGLALAAAFIRPGSPLTPLPERLAYLASAPAGWALAWGVWAACAAAMVSFTFVAARLVGSPLARSALAVAVVAAVADLACDVQYVFSFPKGAFSAGSAAELFVRVERLTNWISLTVANGLYSVSTLLLSLALRAHPAILAVGTAVFASGMLLAAAGVTGVPEHALWATPPTIGLYCLWVLLVARSLTAERSAP
ncbi:MAG TPA: hypothetical protein VGF55_13955 [Gemmataceae bacterium]|jgi:hypothetical protein